MIFRLFAFTAVNVVGHRHHAAHMQHTQPAVLTRGGLRCSYVMARSAHTWWLARGVMLRALHALHSHRVQFTHPKSYGMTCMYAVVVLKSPSHTAE